MLSLFTNYYVLLGVGIFFLGDIVAVPVIYLGAVGTLNFLTISILIIVLNIATDTVWYFFGSLIPLKRLERLFIFKHKKIELEKPPEAFKKHGLKMLFYSKFVYGIRPLVRVFCGIYKISFWEYLTVNFFSTVIWIVGISFLARALDLSLHNLRVLITRGEIAFTIFVVLVFLFGNWAKRVVKEKFKIF